MNDTIDYYDHHYQRWLAEQSEEAYWKQVAEEVETLHEEERWDRLFQQAISEANQSYDQSNYRVS